MSIVQYVLTWALDFFLIQYFEILIETKLKMK